MAVLSVLECSECQGALSLEAPIWACPACGGLLELRIDRASLGERVGAEFKRAAEGFPGETGIWRYRNFLAIDTQRPVSLGEGNTPTIQLRALGRKLGLSNLFAKLEYLAPTGSFKDRGAASLVSKARELGVARLVEDSSGNAGASLAAYCAAAGIRASIYVPSTAPAAKKAQIAFYGAEVVIVEGTRQAVASAALDRCAAEGAYYGSHNSNPFFLEGTKTFAYEVAASFGWDPPDHLVMPVGNGSLFLGSWKGFRDMEAFGVTRRLPKHHAAQATGCMPVVDAFRRGLTQTGPIETSPTIAGGINIDRPSRGRAILRVLHESQGAAAAATDEEILDLQRTLASAEGIFCEPTSAAAFAILPQLVRWGVIKSHERVLVATTGIGLKDPSVLIPVSPV